MKHLANLFRYMIEWVKPNIKFFITSNQPQLWYWALIIGVFVGALAIVFRYGISLVQWAWLGSMSERLTAAIEGQPWWLIMLGPIVAGGIVGIILQFIHPHHRAGGISDVIETRFKGGRELPFRDGLISAIVTAISLGGGASAGREGPVVHLGATFSQGICRYFQLPQNGHRILLACGVASAISASFNAPIAGILFAHEVILRNYALSAFVPVVLASSVATVLVRIQIGDIVAFTIPHYQVTSYWEVPAFFLLGMTCALVAILFQFALISTDYLARSVVIPLWVRPIIGGVVLGSIGIFFPEVLGVGYGATDDALQSVLPLSMLLVLLIVKAMATAITLASRFGGGIIAPSLYLGAMAGGAYGLIAAEVFPTLASSHGLYAILGMGAVTSAILGAPISTTMIVFELTGGYSLSLALLITVSIATGITYAVYGRSFLHLQLESRGVFASNGPHQFVAKQMKAMTLMEPLTKEEPRKPQDSFTTITLYADDSLEDILRSFDQSVVERLPVIDREDRYQIGWIYHIRALRYFNTELINASQEEHR